MGILRMRKQRQSIQRRPPQGAGGGCLPSPPPTTASGNPRPVESPPLASQLAWELWESARYCLTKQERDEVAINLATREFLYVIKLLLSAVIRADAAIPTDLAPCLVRWARTYDSHPDHSVICSLVARAISAGRSAVYDERPLEMHSTVQDGSRASR